jgi:hypothetical protein
MILEVGWHHGLWGARFHGRINIRVETMSST